MVRERQVGPQRSDGYVKFFNVKVLKDGTRVQVPFHVRRETEVERHMRQQHRQWENEDIARQFVPGEPVFVKNPHK